VEFRLTALQPEDPPGNGGGGGGGDNGGGGNGDGGDSGGKGKGKDKGHHDKDHLIIQSPAGVDGFASDVLPS
jgi:hypothetical protein